MKLKKIISLDNIRSKLIDRHGGVLRNPSGCNVLIGMPTYRKRVEEKTHACTVDLMRYSESKGIKVSIVQPDSAIVAKARNDIVDEAVRIGAEWILFIDADMVFQPHYLELLLSHKKDVVGGLCVQRVPPYFSTLYFLDEETDLFVCLDSADPNAIILNSLTKCDATGTAFLLIKTSVFERLRKPYFAMPPTAWLPIVKTAEKFVNDEATIDELKEAVKKLDTIDGFTGEDLYFAKELYHLGVEVFVDTGALIGHIGEFPFTYLDRLAFVETHKTTGKIERSDSGESEDRIRSYAGAGTASLLRATRKAEAVPSVSG